MTETDSFRGTGVAMITPFQENGEIDFDRLMTHTDRLIDQGIRYLVVLGTTAETPTLSARDKQDVISCVIEACGERVPIMLGLGGNDTKAVIEAIKHTDTRKIQGLLTVSPYYNKPSQEGIYQHYAAIASISELPVMLYNVPGRTASNISAETALRLATDFEGTIIGVKEASGNFEQVMEIINNRPEGFLVISGDDAITLPMIAAGGDGAISVIGNAYPALTSLMVAAALDGAYLKARELHYKLFPMMKAIFKEGNPAGVKAAMDIQGWIENVLRLPLIPVTAALYQEISQLHSKLQ
ncbi:MAG: 4-hydroxy-tetrahydrodipicolinate synthase [Bacteroidales bacterium]|nr:4-hydroxy-tetrahydrodipicolinate synthase [Bacteroidales bacterium]